MVKFVIIRHGHSVANKEKVFCGQMDSPLNEQGFEQGRQTGEYVAKNFKIDEIYSSDLVRVTETVRPLANLTGLHINTDKRLREVDVGEWQGTPLADIERDFPTELATYRSTPAQFTFPKGEGYVDMQKRVVDFFEETAKSSEGKTIAVGTHGGCIKTLVSYVEGIALDDVGKIPFAPNASVSVLTCNDGKWSFELMGYADHLDVKSGKFLAV